jgi:hypothetical protein
MDSIPVDETFLQLKHASRCDHCAWLLRQAIAEAADLNLELTEDERTHIESLESAQQEWQARLARQIAEKQKRFLT